MKELFYSPQALPRTRKIQADPNPPPLSLPHPLLPSPSKIGQNPKRCAIFKKRV